MRSPQLALLAAGVASCRGTHTQHLFTNISVHINTTEVLECSQALLQLLDPSYATALAVANDASSNMHLDAFQALSTTVGYPGPIGDYGECSKVHLFAPGPATRTASTQLCLAGSISLNTTQGLPPFGGVCVPRACAPEALEGAELRAWLSAVHAALEASPAATDTQEQYVRNLLEVMGVAHSSWTGFTCGTFRKARFGVDVRIVCALMLLLCAFVLGATVQDLVKSPDFPKDSGDGSPTSARRLRQPSGYLPVGANLGDHVSKYLAAFSIPRNLRRLFHVGDQTELSVFDGLKVISMLWIVLGHLMAVQASVGYVNPEVFMPPNGMVSKPEGQLFFSARFAVDTFFFLSGFLVVYVMLRRFSKSDGTLKKGAMGRWGEWLPFFYLHRFLRILPSYGFCLLLWWKVAPWLGNGPFWYRFEEYIDLCDKYWWSNMLFVNNMVPWRMQETYECFYVTWYLANDMQFYLLSPFFIILFLRNHIAGAAATAGIVAASTAAMVYGTVTDGWSALTLDGEWTVRYSQNTYTMPWFRIVPYLLGMCFAMWWHERSRSVPRLHLRRWQRHACMWGAVCIFLSIIFCAASGYRAYPCPPTTNPDETYCGSGWPIWQRSAYNALTRPLWCLGLVMLCLPCFLNQGGLIQQMLSHRGWVPFARLSFGAYLLHPIIINLWLLNSTAKFHFSRLDLVMSYLCVATATFLSSLLLSLLVEAPMTKLGRYLEDAVRSKSKRGEAWGEKIGDGGGGGGAGVALNIAAVVAAEADLTFDEQAEV
eukprot:TRINITY_DN1110_c1_g1_i2.p1 TRINITY_DN1110_c1_g1~~TRINITY_DN1110_c1_g1_i2.p1  ORF type:complete len:767 (-),score=284.50 TRINITY_DN1110_c1_g1_i2:1197-3497(-)